MASPINQLLIFYCLFISFGALHLPRLSWTGNANLLPPSNHNQLLPFYPPLYSHLLPKLANNKLVHFRRTSLSPFFYICPNIFHATNITD